jgi:hypothetical protein
MSSSIPSGMESSGGNWSPPSMGSVLGPFIGRATPKLGRLVPGAPAPLRRPNALIFPRTLALCQSNSLEAVNKRETLTIA